MMANASDTVKYLYNVLGCDNFLNFIKLLVDEGVLDKKIAGNLTKPFQQKEKKDRSAFQDLIKEQRKKNAVGGKVDGMVADGVDKENVGEVGVEVLATPKKGTF